MFHQVIADNMKVSDSCKWKIGLKQYQTIIRWISRQCTYSRWEFYDMYILGKKSRSFNVLGTEWMVAKIRHS